MKSSHRYDVLDGFVTKLEVSDMINTITVDLSAAYYDIYLSDTDNTPDKHLLFAILERAILDLLLKTDDYGNQKHRIQAIRWFLSPVTTYKNGFSFLQVVKDLNISSRTTKKLVELARAVQYKNGKYYEIYSRYRSGGYRCLRCYNN